MLLSDIYKPNKSAQRQDINYEALYEVNHKKRSHFLSVFSVQIRVDTLL